MSKYDTQATEIDISAEKGGVQHMILQRKQRIH
jgi:hypothetical protein